MRIGWGGGEGRKGNQRNGERSKGAWGRGESTGRGEVGGEGGQKREGGEKREKD